MADKPFTVGMLLQLLCDLPASMPVLIDDCGDYTPLMIVCQRLAPTQALLLAPHEGEE